MEELALKIEHVSKQYRLGAIGGGTLKGDLQTWWARKRGKEDPNSKIGNDQSGRLGERFLALDDVSFEVKKGEAVGIIGHNGAGKSTLLKLLSRVTAPTEGKISINGRIASMLEVGTGFHPELTGRENVYMNGAILGMTRAEIDKKFDQIVEFAEMEKFIDTPVKRYSSGMYVKLAFSVAAHLDSEIMIMDEVLAVGDMAFQKKCLEKMRSAAKEEGRTVLYVSHNMNTIRQLCDRCIVLDHGKLVFDGEVEQAIDVYMNCSTVFAAHIDYSKIPRLNWLQNTSVRTLEAHYIDHNSIRFSALEDMRIALKWKNEKNVEGLCLRLEILHLDRSPVGSSLLQDFYSGKKGEFGTLNIVFPLSNLAPGRYTTNYVFYLKDYLGQNDDTDCVHGLYFEIIPDGDVIWKNKTWGDVHLPDLLIEEIS